MTPRVGVKTTLTMERAFSGLPVPSGSPTFYLHAHSTAQNPKVPAKLSHPQQSDIQMALAVLQCELCPNATTFKLTSSQI